MRNNMNQKTYLYDSDDYKPFEDVKIGDTVRYVEFPEEGWEVLAKGHGAEELRNTIESDKAFKAHLDPWADYGIEDEDIQDWVITDGPQTQPYVYWEYDQTGGVVCYESDNADNLDESEFSDVSYADLKEGDVVEDESGNRFEILDIVGDNKLIVALEDDPRDIRGAIYGQDVIASANGYSLFEESEETSRSGNIYYVDDSVYRQIVEEINKAVEKGFDRDSYYDGDIEPKTLDWNDEDGDYILSLTVKLYGKCEHSIGGSDDLGRYEELSVDYLSDYDIGEFRVDLDSEEEYRENIPSDFNKEKLAAYIDKYCM